MFASKLSEPKNLKINFGPEVPYTSLFCKASNIWSLSFCFAQTTANPPGLNSASSGKPFGIESLKDLPAPP